jgi:hypothetical protein
VTPFNIARLPRAFTSVKEARDSHVNPSILRCVRFPANFSLHPWSVTVRIKEAIVVFAVHSMVPVRVWSRESFPLASLQDALHVATVSISALGRFVNILTRQSLFKESKQAESDNVGAAANFCLFCFRFAATFDGAALVVMVVEK